MHVIASTETVLALSKYTSQLSSLYLSLFAKRQELLDKKFIIQAIDEQVARIGGERDKILDLMKQSNIDGPPDQRKWVVLQQNFEFDQKKIEEHIENRGRLAAELQLKNIKYMSEVVACSKAMMELTIPLLSSVRNELELPFDAVTYANQLEVSFSKQEEDMKQFFDKITSNMQSSPG